MVPLMAIQGYQYTATALTTIDLTLSCHSSPKQSTYMDFHQGAGVIGVEKMCLLHHICSTTLFEEQEEVASYADEVSIIKG